MKQVNNFINGNFNPTTSGEFLDIITPHTGVIIGKLGISSNNDIKNAVQNAQKAFQIWKNWTVKQRIKPLLKLRQLIEQNEKELTKIIMLEHGKNYTEALGSIRKGNETVEYACGIPSLIPGKVLDVSSGVKCEEYKYPHGVCVSIVPFNFPFMVPLWTLPIALACGNCYILKPSEKVPITMAKFFELVQKAGFPPGVIQCVNGCVDVVNLLIDAPEVKAVTFVGSSKIAKLISKRCQIYNKRCLALGGAKNHLIAVPDCNVEMTASDITNSFCGCAGQRCMAASNLLIVGENNSLIEKICEKAKILLPGKKKRQLGPVIDQIAVDRCKRYVDEAEKNGAKILLDGRIWINKEKSGFWFGPTIMLINDLKEPSLHDEIFGPILSILMFNNNKEAIFFENNNSYGNAGSIYTSKGETAEWYRKRLSAGMIGINIGVPVPREPFSFGGINQSRFGSFDITGNDGINFFTWRQKCTSKWISAENKTWMD